MSERNYENDVILRKLMDLERIKKLNEMQKNALTTKGNLVVSSPTGSGKTFVAEYFLMKTALEGKKGIYCAPLKAICNEHYKKFRKKAKEFGISVGISTGDYESKGTELEKYDVLFTTYEKLESLARNRSPFLSELGVLVFDEIHNLGTERGPYIELALAKVKKWTNPRIIGLSATIPNGKEIAKWLNAEFVFYNERPIPLEFFVYHKGFLYSKEKKDKKMIEEIIKETIKRKKQILIFANTRKSSKQLAKKYSEVVERCLTKEEKMKLAKIAKKIKERLEFNTEQEKELVELIKKGVAFHNASLTLGEREIIEENFKKGLIKLIASTPTLAAGVNLPAFRVIIQSLYRYVGYFYQKISVNEFKQMAGRAGRIGFDEKGEVIVVVNKEKDLEEVWEKYINGKGENIYSYLSLEPVLRKALLGLIAGEFTTNWEELEGLFKETFYYFQYGNIREIEGKIREILRLLDEFGFIIYGDVFIATKLGKLVSSLMLDPITAYYLVLGIEDGSKEGLLFSVCSALELIPLPRIKRGEEMYYLLEGEKLEINDALKRGMFFEERVKMFLFLNEWIEEKDVNELLEKYEISPGQFKSYLEILDWLFYSIEEIAKLKNNEKVLFLAKKLRLRIKYGVKEELLPLIAIKGIGKKRARKLFEKGIRNPKELLEKKELGRKILGEKLYEKIIREL